MSETRVFRVKSKSNPKIYREVRVGKGIDGEMLYQCSCPANVWSRVSNRGYGKAECRHIKLVKQRLTK
jgi:predicted nucleic acid-binding Zn finger protein